MNKTKLTKTALPWLIALAAILLSLRLPNIRPDEVAGFVTVLALLGIVALEYRVTWKSLFTNKVSVRR